MIRSMVYESGKGLQQNVDLEKVNELIAAKKNLIWLEVENPAAEDMRILKEEFGFHDLALEDSLNEHQRPKLDEYEEGSYVFLVTLWVDETPEGRLKTHQLSVFIGRNYMVTIHHAPLPAINDSIRRVEQNPALMQHGIGSLVYFVIDNIVDSYFPVLDRIEDRVEDLEQRIIEDGSESVGDIFQVKRDLLTFRKVVAPLRDAFNQFTRQEQTLFTRQSVIYFQDIYDHLLRIQDMIDTYRDMLTSTMDAYLSAVSNRLNTIMKTLTIVATIVLPMTLVTGVYGMNFKYIPELHWRWGYPFSLVLMAGIGIGMWFWIKRKGWW